MTSWGEQETVTGLTLVTPSPTDSTLSKMISTTDATARRGLASTHDPTAFMAQDDGEETLWDMMSGHLDPWTEEDTCLGIFAAASVLVCMADA